MSKADARDWHNTEKLMAQNAKDEDEQLEKLYYCAEKRHDGPDPTTLRELGHDDVARLLDQAYGLLSEAYYLLNSRRPE